MKPWRTLPERLATFASGCLPAFAQGVQTPFPSILLPGYFSLYFTFLILEREGFSLKHSYRGIIGSATMFQVDVAKRIFVFYRSLFLLPLFFFLSLALVHYLKTKSERSTEEWEIASWLSFAGIAALFFRCIHASNDSGINFVATAMICLLGFVLLRPLFRSDGRIETPDLLLWSAGMALSAACVVREFLTAPNLPVVLAHYHVIWGSCVALILLLTTLGSRAVRDFNWQRLIYATTPLFALPLLGFLSTECWLVLNQRDVHLLSPRQWYFMGLLALTALCAILYVISGRRQLPTIPKRLFNLCVPLTLSGLVTLASYSPVIPQPTEMFELANAANAVMRWHTWGEVPFFQSINSHMLSELLFPFAYTAINGFDGSTAFLTYNFLHDVLFVLVAWFFLLRLFENGYYACFIILFFPFLRALIPDYYSMALISTFLLYGVYTSYSFRRILFLFLWTSFMLIWRIDIGIACLFATSILLTPLTVKYLSKHLLKECLRAALCIVIPSVILAFSVACILDVSIFTQVRQALDYFGASQAHGYVGVTSSDGRFNSYHYLILPIAILAASALSLGYLLKDLARTVKVSFMDTSTLLLAIFYFANFQRGLVRHGLIEGSDVQLSSFAFMILALSCVRLLKAHAHSSLAFVIVGTLLIDSLHYPDCKLLTSVYQNFTNAYAEPLEITADPRAVQRVIPDPGFAEKTYDDLKRFLDGNFDDGATFLDFSNSPMLYFYTGRRVPSCFNQYMQNTVTDYLQDANLRLIETMDVPVVVFSHVPERWFDNVDGVPNSLRHRKISRHIFTNYRPFALLDGYAIWIRKDVRIEDEQYPALDPSISQQPRTFDLARLAYVMGQYDPAPSRQTLMQWPPMTDIPLPAAFDKTRGNDLSLVIRSDSADYSNAEIMYSERGIHLGSFTFDIRPSVLEKTYIVPLSTQYNWYAFEPDRLTIRFSEPSAIHVDSIALCTAE